jgi:lipopolysaccharide export system permease protein
LNGWIADKLYKYRPHGSDEVILNILQKYIFRELLWTFLAVTMVLLIVMIGIAFGELLSDIAGGRVPAGLIGILIVLKMPDVLSMIVPIGVFIAVIWGLGRFYRDQEMAVMRASGFNWQMMLRPLFNLLLPVAAVLLLIGLFLSPAAASAVQQKLEDAFRNAAEWGLQTGKFHVLKGGDLVLYVEAVEKDGRTLRHVFIQQKQGDREQVWNAEKGYYWLDRNTGNRYLTLENGQITEGGGASLDYGIISFSRNDLKLPQPENQSKTVALEARSSRELVFSTEPGDIAEIQWRISSAIAAIVMGLLAIPLSHSAPGEGRGGRALMGILAYTVYANLIYMCRSWITDGAIPSILGMWWIHVLVLISALIWLQRQGRVVGKG